MSDVICFLFFSILKANINEFASVSDSMHFNRRFVHSRDMYIGPLVHLVCECKRYSRMQCKFCFLVPYCCIYKLLRGSIHRLCYKAVLCPSFCCYFLGKSFICV